MTRCLNESMLQAWLDGELSPEASAAARSHLAGCAACNTQARAAEKTWTLVDNAWQVELPALVPTARLRARIEERLTEPSARTDRLWWWPIGFRPWQFGAAIAVLAIAVAGAISIQLRPDASSPPQTARRTAPETPTKPPAPINAITKSVAGTEDASPRPVRPLPEAVSKQPTRRPTWLESETNRHLGQTQLLLRSVRNAETETDPDLAYERELSRELLSRNRLLRRRAQQKDERRAEELLTQIEPLLLDIANLPEQPALEEMRSLKELIRDQQIIAELQLYAGRNLF